MDAPVISAGAVVGRMLGHYRVLEQIGAGGMGEVYRAHDEHLDREIAIKVLPAGTLADDASRKQFRKEALVLSKLNHPNVATVHDFDTQDGVDFLVMEYVPGTTLTQKLSAGPLPENELVRLAEQLAEGLSAAHSHGVVHRDLKPSNLRITPDGWLKILDFGLAALRPPTSSDAETESLTTTRPLAGTLPYMAPEQLRGERLDARCDIWAAGVVLYQTATGHLPFLEKVSTATADAILHKPCLAPSSLQPSVSSHVEEVILKCLEKDPENRYQSATELAVDLRRIRRDAESSFLVRAPTRDKSSFMVRHWKLAIPTAVLLVAAITGTFWYLHVRTRTAPPLTDRDTIVLADFNNSTGDSVFDDTLKQALAIQLGQSPFLNITSEAAINEALRRMGHTGTERLVGNTGREICQRVGSKCVVEGSIAALGSEYVLGLKAVNCLTGEVISQEQAQVAHKEEILNAVGRLASQLRSRLGESLSTIQKFEVPSGSPTEVTTTSLEALQAYSLGVRTSNRRGLRAAIPYYKRAIELDPNFARAYANMGNMFVNLGQPEQASQYIRKAYDLRERVTTRERLHIEAKYYLNVTGELDKAAQALELLVQFYPRSTNAYVNLGVYYGILGQYETSVNETLEAQRQSPDSVFPYTNAAVSYMCLGRFDDADHTLSQAYARKLAPEFLLPLSYNLAFLRNKEQEMKRLVSAASSVREAEYSLFDLQAATEAYFGRLRMAREFSRRAEASARHADNSPIALTFQLESVLRELEFGNVNTARRQFTTVSAQNHDWQLQPLALLALARLGDPRVQQLNSALRQRFPLDTLVNDYWFPSIAAAAALNAHQPRRAIDLLDATSRYELGQPATRVTSAAVNFYSVLLRGEAYLNTGESSLAQQEFRKILDHPGIALNSHIVPLAHLGVAHARVLAHDIPGARNAYQEFFTLWKDADPDIPVLKQAKAEYMKLQY